MKQTSITKMSAISDSDDAPKLTQADFDRASFRVGEKPISKAEWADAVRARLGKQRINIMLDRPIIEHFKALAGERGYQTLINDTLRRSIEAGSLEADLRKIIREELREIERCGNNRGQTTI
jgi:uncharacterized protein (DUF4415 family)